MPPPVAVKVELVPAQITCPPLMLATGFGVTVKVLLAVAVQPLVVTVTVYVPAVFTVMDDVVAPVDHAYVPPPVAVKVELVPAQITCPPLMLTTGFGVTVRVLLAVAVQPFAVTVTV